jgi:glutamate racemase
MLKKYLAPLLAKEIDTLILGCTHYGLLEAEISEIVGPRISVINESVVVSKKLQEYLVRHPEVTEKLSKNRSVKFYSTDSPSKFEALGGQFIGRAIEVQKINL